MTNSTDITSNDLGDVAVETQPDEIDLDLGRPRADLVPLRDDRTSDHVRDLQHRLQFSRKIAQMRESRLLSRAELREMRIISSHTSSRRAANVFRDIRRKVMQFCGPRAGNFITMVSSVTDSGGASLTALNLGAAFALDDTKTAVVVDCNLDNPNLAGLLGMTPDAGLTDFLEDTTLTTGDIIYPTGIPRLRLIPAGRQRESSTEYFSSIRMEELLIELKARYPDRYVILDGPPIGVSADASALCDLCDCAVLVVPYGRCTEDQITEAAVNIGKDKLAGVVMNDEPHLALSR